MTPIGTNAALHHDVDTDRYHAHLAINKVSLDGRVLDRWQDFAKLGRAAEWCEREMGCKSIGMWLGAKRWVSASWGSCRSSNRNWRSGSRRGSIGKKGATIDRRDAARRTHYSWVDLLKRDAVPAATQAVARDGASWDDLHAVLRGYGVR